MKHIILLALISLITLTPNAYGEIEPPMDFPVTLFVIYTKTVKDSYG